MEKQVDKHAYKLGRYTKIDRWGSYFYQLEEALALSPESILEVGVGEGVFRDYIKGHTDIRYQSFDVAEDLSPDVLGDVTDIPLKNESFDMVCAFEVLEHLPFKNFEKAVSELFRISKRYVIISLPHFGPPVFFDLKIPFLPRIRFAFKIPFPRKHVFNGQHYWEIGKRGYAPSRIRQCLERHGSLIKEFVPFENQYHHFFVLSRVKGPTVI